MDDSAALTQCGSKTSIVDPDGNVVSIHDKYEETE